MTEICTINLGISLIKSENLFEIVDLKTSETHKTFVSCFFQLAIRISYQENFIEYPSELQYVEAPVVRTFLQNWLANFSWRS